MSGPSAHLPLMSTMNHKMECTSTSSDNATAFERNGTEVESTPMMDIKPAYYYGDTDIPVFTPSMEEFKDFNAYVTAINKYGMESGIVKVIPPKEWVSALPPLDETVKKIRIKNPITQHIIGTGGVFRQQNIEKKRTYTIAEWKAMSETSDHQPPAKRGEKRYHKTSKYQKRHKVTDQTLDEQFKGFNYRFDDSEFTKERCEELENVYWRTLTFNSPMYGADVLGSLFDSRTKIWNVANLDNILNDLPVKVPGVNEAYLYAGLWKSTFSWHLEDMDLYSINYIHFGAPKQWYSISQKDKDRFFNVMKDIWPEEYKNCKEFLRHKTFLVSPSVLKRHNITVNKLVHYQNEFVITYPYGYHAGFNYGYNCAESVNFALEEWISYGQSARKCECIPDAVAINMNEILKLCYGTVGLNKSMVEGLNGIGIDPPESAALEMSNGTGQEDELSEPKRKKMKKAPDVEYSCLLCTNTVPKSLSKKTIFRLIETDADKKAHFICAKAFPGIVVNRYRKSLTASDTKRALGSRRSQKCSLCGSTRGLLVHCGVDKCRTAYHGSCAVFAGMLLPEMQFKTSGDDILWGCDSSTSSKICLHHRRKLFPPSTETSEFCDNWASKLSQGSIVQLRNRHGGSGDSFQSNGSKFMGKRVPIGIVMENTVTDKQIRVYILNNGTGSGLKGSYVTVAYSQLLPPPEGWFNQIEYKPILATGMKTKNNTKDIGSETVPRAKCDDASAAVPNSPVSESIPETEFVLSGTKPKYDPLLGARIKRNSELGINETIDKPLYEILYTDYPSALPVHIHCDPRELSTWIIEEFTGDHYTQNGADSGIEKLSATKTNELRLLDKFGAQSNWWYYRPDESSMTVSYYSDCSTAKLPNDPFYLVKCKRRDARTKKQPKKMEFSNAVSPSAMGSEPTKPLTFSAYVFARVPQNTQPSHELQPCSRVADSVNGQHDMKYVE